MLQSQIECDNVLCLYQSRPLWNCTMETRYIPKEFRLCSVTFLTVQLYIQWDQFIIFQVTLPTPSHKVPSNFMLVLKLLHLTLLNIVTLLNLKVVLGDHHNRPKNLDYIHIKNCQSQLSKRQEYCCPNCLWNLKTKSLPKYSSVFCSFLYYQTKTNGKKRTHGRSPK